MPLASEGVRLLTNPSSTFMLPSTFQGGGAQVSSTANNPTTNEEQIREVRDTRTVTFQDSYDELTPSSSRSLPMRNEPSRLVGFQKDQKLQERQRQQQRVKSKTTNAPIDLRDTLNAGKRAREQGGQSSSKVNRGAPAPSPTQPEARRQKVTKEWLTTTEMRQLDITARDAVRLQREIPATTAEGSPSRQKFECATSKGDQATQRTIEKATIGVLYTRSVNRPIFTANGCPPWFERLQRDLQRDNFILHTSSLCNQPIN